jgi:WD40 repeat protein
MTALAIAPDGSWLATATGDTARIWGVDGKLRATLSGHLKRVTSITVAPDGSWLATAARSDATVRIWAADGTLRATLTGRTAWLEPLEGSWPKVAIAPDGSWLATRSVRTGVDLGRRRYPERHLRP